MKQIFATILLSMPFFTLGAALAADVVPTDIQQPGTQPGEIGNLESSNKGNKNETIQSTRHVA